MSRPEYTEEEDAAYYRYVEEEERKAKLASASKLTAQPAAYDEPSDEEYYAWLAEQELKAKVSQMTENKPSQQPVPPINYNTNDVKIVSLGITNHVQPSPRDAQIQKRMEKTDKFQKYQEQMAADRDRVIEDTRKPFARKQYDDYDREEKFVIGKPIDPESLHHQKRESQMAYQRALQADQQMKPIADDRKKIVQKYPTGPASPTNSMRGGGQNSGMAEFGRDEEYEHMVKRRAAIEVQLRNNDLAYTNREAKYQNDRDDRESVSPLDRGYSERDRRAGAGERNSVRDYGDRGSDIRKFEEAEYRYIGEQASDAKTRKSAQAHEYMRQLQADAAKSTANNNYDDDRSYGGRSQQVPLQRGEYYDQNPPSPDAYVNKSGWTGLNVGGASTGNSLSLARLDSKHGKQAEYKRQLDLQREEAEEIARRNEYRYAQRELR